MLSIRGPEVSLGSLRFSNRRAQSPTPHAPALGTYLPILSAVQLPHEYAVDEFQSFESYGMPKAHAHAA